MEEEGSRSRCKEDLKGGIIKDNTHSSRSMRKAGSRSTSKRMIVDMKIGRKGEVIGTDMAFFKGR